MIKNPASTCLIILVPAWRYTGSHWHAGESKFTTRAVRNATPLLESRIRYYSDSTEHVSPVRAKISLEGVKQAPREMPSGGDVFFAPIPDHKTIRIFLYSATVYEKLCVR